MKIEFDEHKMRISVENLTFKIKWEMKKLTEAWSHFHNLLNYIYHHAKNQQSRIPILR